MALQSIMDKMKSPEELWYSEVRRGFSHEQAFDINWDDAKYLYLDGYTSQNAIKALKSIMGK